MPIQQNNSMMDTVQPTRAPLIALPPPTLSQELGVSTRQRRIDARGYFLRRLLLLADAAALLCAFAAAEFVVGFALSGQHSFMRGLLLMLIAIPGWVVFAGAHNLYHLDSRRTDHSAAEELAPIVWMTTLWCWTILLLGTAVGLRAVSVTKLGVFWLATVVFLLVFRSIVRAWARRQQWYVQRAVIVGTRGEAAKMACKILRHPEYGFEVVAYVEIDDDDPGSAGCDQYAGMPADISVIRGDVDLVEILAELEVDRAILAPSVHRDMNFAEVLTRIRELRVQLDIVPSWGDVVGSRVDLHELEGMPLISIPDHTLGRSSLVAKRTLDIVAALVGLILALPVMLACAIAIKLDSPGAVLFRQRRVGRGDRRFELLKFRSMRSDAEQVKHEVASLNFHGGGTATGMFKVNGDPRITRVGRFLRRLSLDELPQLFNVLRGDMSLVGPRPLIENEDSQIEGRHRRRITLTPGLTGLWQVNGRSDIPFEGMIDLDYLYVTNWSLWGDIKLLMKTVSVVLRGHGAY